MMSRKQVLEKVRGDQLAQYDEFIRGHVFMELDRFEGRVRFDVLTSRISRIPNAVYRDWLRQADKRGEIIFCRVDGIEWISRVN